MLLSTLKEKNPHKQAKTLSTVIFESYCIISLGFYFIMSGIVFVFVFCLGHVIFRDF